MKPDPVFSGEALKAAALLLVALAIGGAAIAVATGGLHVNAPHINLPDSHGGPVTDLQNTNLSNTTIDGSLEQTVDQPTPEPGAAPAPAADPFSGTGLAGAIAKVGTEVGPYAELTRLSINDVQTQFIVRTGGDGVAAYSVRADSGELDRQDASITISGNATLDDFDFKLGAVKPAAIDPMLAHARKLSGASDFRPSVLSLERDLSSGLTPPHWTINAEGNGRYLLFKAAIDGKHVKAAGGQGPPIPQAAVDARKLNDCIQNAGGDVDTIEKCVSDFSP